MLASLYTREGISFKQRCSSERCTIMLEGQFGIRGHLRISVSLRGYVNAEEIRNSVVAAMYCFNQLSFRNLKLRITTCVGSS